MNPHRNIYTTVKQDEEGNFANLAITESGYVLVGDIYETLAEAEYDITTTLKIMLNDKMNGDYRITRVEDGDTRIEKALDTYYKYQKPFWKQIRFIDRFITISWGRISKFLFNVL